MLRVWICIILGALVCATGQAETPVVVKPMSELRQRIADAVANKAQRVVIPPGVYRGDPAGHGAVHLALNNVSDLEIVTDGVTMICTRRTRAIAFNQCRNVTLSGLTIDYDPLTFTQGKVIAVAEKLAKAQPWSLWKAGGHYARVTLDRPATFDAGQSLYSPDRQGCAFVFRHSRLHSSGRILVKASDGVIEDNTLLAPHAIVLCPDLPGESAAGIHDITIRRNTIVESGYFCPAPWSSQAGAISITASGPGGHLGMAGVFDGITIEDNTFRGICGVNLCIASSRNVLIKGNRFIDTHQTRPTDTGAQYKIGQSAVVWLNQCQGVRFEDNQVIGQGPFAGRLATIEPTVQDVTGLPDGLRVHGK